jgi:hypothetical protein
MRSERRKGSQAKPQSLTEKNILTTKARRAQRKLNTFKTSPLCELCAFVAKFLPLEMGYSPQRHKGHKEGINTY